MIKCSFNKALNVKMIFAYVLIAFILFLLLKFMILSPSNKEELLTYRIVVNDKDTLWSIASSISKEKDMNIRKIIYDIQDVNHMSSSNIYTGQTLFIPIYH